MLRDVLNARRERIHERWLDLILAGFPPDSQAFLRSERDRFRNPVGHTFRQETAAILAGLIGGGPTDGLRAPIDNVVRIRAVQDCPPSEAAGFFFVLKQAIREELTAEPCPGWSHAELLEFETELDRLALLAFDIYSGCRERIHQINARATQMRVAKLLERLSRQPEDSNEGAALLSGDDL